MRMLFSHHLPPPLSPPNLLYASLSANHTLSTESGLSSSPAAGVTPLYSTFNSSIAVTIIALLCAFFIVAFVIICFVRCAGNDSPARNREAGAAATLERAAARGLDKALIDSLPLITFTHAKTMQAGDGVSECVVCLIEFEGDETLRLLPKCNHVFHQDCIDAWLSSHTTCPLCRHSLLDIDTDEKRCGTGVEPQMEVAIPVINGEDGAKSRSESSRYGIAAGSSSSGGKGRRERRLRRWNSTGHSLVRIHGRPHSCRMGQANGEAASQLDCVDELHRSRSYAADADAGRGEWRGVSLRGRADVEKGNSSSKRSWKAFSFRRPSHTRRPAQDSSPSICDGSHEPASSSISTGGMDGNVNPTS